MRKWGESTKRKKKGGKDEKTPLCQFNSTFFCPKRIFNASSSFTGLLFEKTPHPYSSFSFLSVAAESANHPGRCNHQSNSPLPHFNTHVYALCTFAQRNTYNTDDRHSRIQCRRRSGFRATKSNRFWLFPSNATYGDNATVRITLISSSAFQLNSSLSQSSLHQ